MKLISKNNKKKYSLKRLINSFGYAIRGIYSAFKTEQNLVIHTIVTIIVIALAIYLQVSTIELCILILVIGLVIAFEMMNTAIEYVVDMAMPNIHPLARLAKDISSGAVLVCAIASIIIGLIIFIPKIVLLF